MKIHHLCFVDLNRPQRILGRATVLKPRKAGLKNRSPKIICSLVRRLADWLLSLFQDKESDIDLSDFK
jgi:hypothetical protein